MASGCATADEISASTGAASYCGSCIQALTTLTGDPVALRLLLKLSASAAICWW